ncbi:hypothetical protein AGLY_009058 [Aphis glycines]|uniref:Uncharacterized protein n=1 Tax=Aphis glycines TaxID=307491 RepID=A0A6G0TIW9_APHGL|nr:hypothetical protein AGLY_009058 [Aphis glycines]
MEFQITSEKIITDIYYIKHPIVTGLISRSLASLHSTILCKFVDRQNHYNSILNDWLYRFPRQRTTYTVIRTLMELDISARGYLGASRHSIVKIPNLCKEMRMSSSPTITISIKKTWEIPVKYNTKIGSKTFRYIENRFTEILSSLLYTKIEVEISYKTKSDTLRYHNSRLLSFPLRKKRGKSLLKRLQQRQKLSSQCTLHRRDHTSNFKGFSTYKIIPNHQSIMKSNNLIRNKNLGGTSQHSADKDQK